MSFVVLGLLCGAEKPPQELVPHIGNTLSKLTQLPTDAVPTLHSSWLTAVLSPCSSRPLYLSCLQPVGDMGRAASIEPVLSCSSPHILTSEMCALITLYGNGLTVQGHQHRQGANRSILICLATGPGKQQACGRISRCQGEHSPLPPM